MEREYCFASIRDHYRYPGYYHTPRLECIASGDGWIVKGSKELTDEEMAAKIKIPKTTVTVNYHKTGERKNFRRVKPIHDVEFQKKIISNKSLTILPDSDFQGALIACVVIPTGIKEIGARCFYGCKYLREVLFEDGSELLIINEAAFAESGLTSFILPRNVKKIPKQCFSKCADLTEFALEERNEPSLTELDFGAFEYSGIKRFEIPQYVTRIGENCFCHCESLQSVTFDEGSCIETIPNHAFEGSRLETFRMPKSVRYIGDYSFASCGDLKHVKFDSKSVLSTIGAHAFQGTPMKVFRITKCVTELGESAFEKCENLIKIAFEDECELKKIGPRAFAECPVIRSIAIPESIEEIGDEAFSSSSKLSDIVFSEDGCNLKRIGARAFESTSIRNIDIPKSVEILGEGAFKDCELKGISFERGSQLMEIGENAFSGSSITKICIPKGVDTIKKDVFKSCQLLSDVVFEKSSIVKDIESGAFACSGIGKIEFPASIEVIGDNAFEGCWRLISMEFQSPSKLMSIGTHAFERTSSPMTVIVSRNDEPHIDKLLFADDTGLNRKDVSLRRAHSTNALSSESSQERICVDDMVVDLRLYQEKEILEQDEEHKVCVCERDGKKFVVKSTKSSSAAQTDFRRETSNLVMCMHPFVIRLRGVVIPNRDNGFCCVVITDYAPGGTLAAILRDKEKPIWYNETKKALMIYAIALGMEAVHSHNVIHRNLRPENIFLDSENMPLIGGFGKSRRIAPDDDDLERTGMTRNPDYKYTYDAPELLMAEDGTQPFYTEKVDVFSFGSLMYEIATGYPPISQGNIGFLPLRVRNPRAPPEVTEFTGQLMQRCHSQDPDERPTFSEICSIFKKKAHLLIEDASATELVKFMYENNLID